MKPKALIAIPIIILAGCRGESTVNFPAPLSIHRQQFVTQAHQSDLFPDRVISQLRSHLYRKVSKEKLPGLALYISTSDGVWGDAAGLADVDSRTRLKGGDRFRIASLTKMFVAVVCLQLVEEQTLSLDQSVTEWLPPEFREAFPQPITLRQLLNHTSGLPDPYTDAFKQAVRANPGRKWQAQDILQYVERRSNPLPQGNFFYSNTNYLLLELIIEKVTGHSLAQEIRQRILTPLAMKDTFLETKEPIPGGFVSGYDQGDEEDSLKEDSLKNVTQPLINDGLGLGDSGLVSTAPDLVRFMRGLFGGGKLLYGDTLKQMMTLVDGDQRDSYGLGMSYRPTLWGEAWGHSGKAIGFMSDLMYLPAHDMVIVAWTNTSESDRGNPTEIIQESLRTIFGKTR
jgi:D-alanyl-D-alanine carboxypeptidase